MKRHAIPRVLAVVSCLLLVVLLGVPLLHRVSHVVEVVARFVPDVQVQFRPREIRDDPADRLERLVHERRVLRQQVDQLVDFAVSSSGSHGHGPPSLFS